MPSAVPTSDRKAACPRGIVAVDPSRRLAKSPGSTGGGTLGVLADAVGPGGVDPVGLGVGDGWHPASANATTAPMPTRRHLEDSIMIIRSVRANCRNRIPTGYPRSLMETEALVIIA
jgi:hypothetical protein